MNRTLDLDRPTERPDTEAAAASSSVRDWAPKLWGGARKGDWWARSQIIHEIIDSGLLREGVEVYQIQDLATRILAKLTGRTADQVRLTICSEIIDRKHDVD